MTTRVQFFSDMLDGATAQLWTMQPMPGGFPGVPGFDIPLVTGSGAVAGGAITFTPAPTAPFALRVRDANATFMRSGALDLTSGTVDEDTGDFSIAYFIIQPAQPTVFAPGALAGLLPAVPFTTNDEDGNPEFRVTSIGLAVTGNTLTATGTGVYLQTPIGGPVSFTYEFRLTPATNPFNVGRLLRVETVRSSVVSTSPGLTGFFINLIANIVLLIMEEDVAGQIEDSVQAGIDASVAASLTGAGATEGTTVTVTSVTINAAAGITIDALAAVNTQGLCPTEVTFGSVRLRPVDQVRALAAMRDRVLRGTLHGEAYLAMFNDYRKDLLWLLLRHPGLLKQADAVVATGLNDFDPKDPGRGVMSRATAAAATQLLEMVAKLAAPELAALARSLVPDVAQFVGRPVGEVLGCPADKK